MNRLAREIAKQGKGDCFSYRGKLYRPERGPNRPGFSEVRLIKGSICRSVFPGRYGQLPLGFRALEEAGSYRRRVMAMPKYRDFERASFKRMAREAISFSASLRPNCDGFAFAEAAE